MTAIATPAGERRGLRGLVFRLAAGLFAALLLAVHGAGLLEPWSDPSGYVGLVGRAAAERWHDAQSGALAVVLVAGSLLALLWRPRAQPLLLQFVALVALALAVVGAPLGLALVGAPAALCLATYPAPRELLWLARPRAWSRPMLALSLLAAALLVPEAWRALRLQAAGADGHAASGHWSIAALLALALALAGALAATRRPGWQSLGVLTGAALIYLGLVAVMLPEQAGSWGSTGGALATIGGWAFVGITLLEARRERS